MGVFINSEQNWYTATQTIPSLKEYGSHWPLCSCSMFQDRVGLFTEGEQRYLLAKSTGWIPEDFKRGTKEKYLRTNPHLKCIYHASQVTTLAKLSYICDLYHICSQKMLHLGPLLHLRPQQCEPEPILCGVVSLAMQMLIQ